MQLTTVISLLLFVYAVCTLQLYHEERRGFRSLSIIPCHSIQAISRRRLGSSIVPNIIPRGNRVPACCSIHETVKELRELKRNRRVDEIVSHDRVKIYRVHPPSQIGDKSLVVKEIHVGGGEWPNEETVEDEVSALRDIDQLYGALQAVDGSTVTYFILMKDMGKRWTPGRGFPEGEEAIMLMDRASDRYERHYAMERVLPYDIPHPGLYDKYYEYVWIRHPNGLWEANPVGGWRWGACTGGIPEKHIPKNRHYCGIREWTEHGLPVFSEFDITIHLDH